ncbi:MAG: EamA family transporter [Solirubrobacterales bacterium]
MLAIALALGSSLAWGVSDFLGGLKSRTVSLLAVLVISQGTALILLAAVVASLAEGPPGGEFLLYAALAGLAEAVGVAALYRGLAVGVMSIVAPVAATAPVVPVAVGIALGELPSPLQGAGIALAAVGIFVTASQPDSVALSRSGTGASVVFGLLTALGFGAFYVAMDAASEGEIPWALMVARLTTVGVFGAAILATRSGLAMRRSDVPVIALIGVVVIAGDSMYATASTHGLLSVVAVLSTLYPIVTIALARAFLAERIERRQWIGITMCLSGVVAISAG